MVPMSNIVERTGHGNECNCSIKSFFQFLIHTNSHTLLYKGAQHNTVKQKTTDPLT